MMFLLQKTIVGTVHLYSNILATVLALLISSFVFSGCGVRGALEIPDIRGNKTNAGQNSNVKGITENSKSKSDGKSQKNKSDPVFILDTLLE